MTTDKKTRPKKKKKKQSKVWRNIKERVKVSPIGSLIVFFIIMLLVVAVWAGLAKYVIENYYDVNKTDAGQRGDTFGILNSLFAALAFAGLVYTILLQQKELKETRQEFIEQNKTLRFQRFESTFFNLLAGRNNLITEFVVNMKDKEEPVSYKGRQILLHFNSKLRNLIKLFDFSQTDKIDNDTIKQMQGLFSRASLGYSNFIELYVANLRAILNYIDQSQLFEDSYSEKEFYFSIVRSQMTFEERTFLFYYMAICDPESPMGRYLFPLREMEEYYQFNRYSDAYLAHPSHFKLQIAWGGFEFYEDEDFNTND